MQYFTLEKIIGKCYAHNSFKFFSKYVMRFSNKLEKFLTGSLPVFETKWFFLRNHLSQMIFLLLFGFLVGSLFGGIANTIKEYYIGEGSLGITIIFITEVISYLTYRIQDRPFLFFLISSNKLHQNFWRFLNMFKIGLIFGFFIDAFKVGS